MADTYTYSFGKLMDGNNNPPTIVTYFPPFVRLIEMPPGPSIKFIYSEVRHCILSHCIYHSHLFQEIKDPHNLSYHCMLNYQIPVPDWGRPCYLRVNYNPGVIPEGTTYECEATLRWTVPKIYQPIITGWYWPLYRSYLDWISGKYFDPSRG